ncbi:MAG: hypothetical protein WBQ95_10800 [Terracidiphilus sp.]
MRTVNLKIVPVLSTLVLAGSGLYSPVAHAGSLQFQIASPQLLLAALTTDDDDAATTEPSIVGLWKQI